MIRRRAWISVPALAAVLAAVAALAVSAMPAEAQTLTLDMGDETSATRRILQLLILTTVLSLAPSILVMVTSFTRIVVVLHFVRQAMGAQGTPPNMVMVSLALFLTGFVMAPTFQTSYTEGISPYLEGDINETEAFDRSVQPVRDFMLAHVRERDLRLFLDMAEIETVETPEATPLRALIPAFMISELRRAFEIGFLIFIPFLIIDMVTASVLMSMGMMMLPPIIIALPFKLIFFVLVDGWYLVAGSLVQSFAT